MGLESPHLRSMAYNCLLPVFQINRIQIKWIWLYMALKLSIILYRTLMVKILWQVTVLKRVKRLRSLRRKKRQLPLKSTKRPLKQEKKLNKRQKAEAGEDELIKKAIECMDKATGSSTEDGLDLFGRYVTTELWAVRNVSAQRWAKLQIQNILYGAHGDVQQPMPSNTSPFLPPYQACYRSQTPTSSNSSCIEQWSPPFPSCPSGSDL